MIPRRPTTSVFQPVPAVESGEQPNVANFEEVSDRIERVTGFRTYKLPSGGFLYPQDSPLSAGEVRVRAVRADEESLLSEPASSKRQDIGERILKECVRTSRNKVLKEPLQLLSQDRVGILICLRVMTFGPLYKSEPSCPRCGHLFEVHVDLDQDLDVVRCEDPTFREPLRDVLPQSHLVFEYRLPRGYDERVVDEHRTKLHKRPRLVSEGTLGLRVRRHVTRIEGCATEEQREKALRDLGIQDLYHVCMRLDFPPFGVNTAVLVTCPQCQTETAARLPFGPSL